MTVLQKWGRRARQIMGERVRLQVIHMRGGRIVERHCEEVAARAARLRSTFLRVKAWLKRLRSL